VLASLTVPSPNRDSSAPEPATPERARARTQRASGVAEKPTIRLVAERANVAVSTVSRVLNGGYASEAARGRVQSAVQELGYTPSMTAQSLVTGRTGCIGVISYTSQTSWFSQILSGIQETLVGTRRSVVLSSLVVNGVYDPKPVAEWIQNRRVDGLIFVRYTRHEMPLFAAAQQAGLPLVLIGPDLKGPADKIVRCNNVAAGRLVAEHLLALGHRRVFFYGGPRESLDTRDRQRGLSQVFEECGIELPGDLITYGSSYTPQAGTEYAQAFLALPASARPTAVVLGSDAMALGFLREVLAQGVRVPADVSVVGFDGVPEGALYWPGLTTVFQPVHRMGVLGCEALLKRLESPATLQAAESTLDVELIVRESTAPPRL
jgi:LacI family transcriptional regulator